MLVTCFNKCSFCCVWNPSLVFCGFFPISSYVGFTASMSKVRTTGRGVSETAEKLANIAISTRRQSIGQPRPSPPMKAGGHWIAESGNFLLRPAQEISTGRAYSRKVAGWRKCHSFKNIIDGYLWLVGLHWWVLFFSLVLPSCLGYYLSIWYVCLDILCV